VESFAAVPANEVNVSAVRAGGGLVIPVVVALSTRGPANLDTMPADFDPVLEQD